MIAACNRRLALLLLPAALSVSEARAQQTPVPLVNPGFEGAYLPLAGTGTVTGSVAPGWTHNAGYGDTTTVYAQDSGNPHSGASCDSIAVSAVRSGNLQLNQGVHLAAGSIYTVGAWFRGRPGSSAGINVQGGPPNYRQFASSSLQVTPDWQFVTAQGYVNSDEDGSIVIGVSQPGTICVDDVTLSSRPGTLTPRPVVGPIPPGFFGIHIAGFPIGRLRNPKFGDPQQTVGLSPDPIRGTIAHDWEDNSSWADVDIDYYAGPTRMPGVAQAQTVKVNAVRSGQQQLRQRLALLAGQSYTLTASVSAAPGTHVQMLISNNLAPYNSYASRDLTGFDGTWHNYAITGTVGDKGLVNLMFASDAPGSYSVGNVRLTQSDGKPARSGVIFPPNEFGILRLWDSSTTWSLLEPVAGIWQFDQLDRWVAARRPGQDIILTLGQSPTWASSDPSRFSYYGSGASAAPTNISDWTNYIRTVATRYKGRIKYYELWNEPNDPTFYSGTVDQLLALTKAASDTLRQADPAAKLITAPAYETGYLDRYLASGAAQYADVIGYHIYSTPPEDDVLQFGNVQLVLDKYAITKPLWITEGGSGDATTPADVAATLMARKYLVDLAFGAGNFSWYQWGPVTPFAVGTVQDGVPFPTPAAKAFAVLHGWLAGASIVAAAIDGNGVWSVSLTLSNGRHALIVWSPVKTNSFTPPAEFASSIRKTLSGQQTRVKGAFELTFAPVLLVTG